MAEKACWQKQGVEKSCFIYQGREQEVEQGYELSKPAPDILPPARPYLLKFP